MTFRKFWVIVLNTILLFTILIFLKIIIFSKHIETEIGNLVQGSEDYYIKINPPPSLQVYYKIHQYAPQYDIPIHYAYGIARAETGWMGPLHFEYNHAQISHAGALGPMQIMPATSRGLWPDWEYDYETVLRDIDFNVHSSMKLLRENYDRWGDWKIVFGAYNTGRPIVNGYAHYVYDYKIYREWDWKMRRTHRHLLAYATTKNSYENYQ